MRGAGRVILSTRNSVDEAIQIGFNYLVSKTGLPRDARNDGWVKLALFHVFGSHYFAVISRIVPSDYLLCKIFAYRIPWQRNRFLIKPVAFGSCVDN